MSEIYRKCWFCDLCGHCWLATDDDPPTQCARCKKRGWNNPPNTPMTVRVPKGPKRPPDATAVFLPDGVPFFQDGLPVGIPSFISTNPQAYTASGMDVVLNRQPMTVHMIQFGSGPMGWGAEFRPREEEVDATG